MIKILKITSADLKTLAELYRQLINKETNLHTMKLTFEKINNNDDYFLIGAKTEDGILIGTIMGIICMDMVKECQPFMVLENFIIDEKYRSKGIGTLLMEKIESIAKDCNCIFIEFCSSSFRTQAHRFYESIGYNPSEVKGYRKYL